MKRKIGKCFLLCLGLSLFACSKTSMNNPTDPNSITGFLYGVGPATVLTRIISNPSIVATNAPSQIKEGKTAFFNVNFNAAIANNVTVKITSNDTSRIAFRSTEITDANSNSYTLDFTTSNYNKSQGLMIVALSSTSMADTTVTITLTPSDMKIVPTSFDVAFQNSKTQYVVVKNSSNQVLSDTGGYTIFTPGSSLSYTLQLAYVPASSTTDTTVTVTNISTNQINYINANPTSFSFSQSNYNVPQTVTISATPSSAATAGLGFKSSWFDFGVQGASTASLSITTGVTYP